MTILLLRWHKALRSPMDVIDPSSVEAVEVVSNGRDPLGVGGATGNSVSIMVMYRPKKPVKVKSWAGIHQAFLNSINSWLSRLSTARGSCTGLVTVGPTKLTYVFS